MVATHSLDTRPSTLDTKCFILSLVFYTTSIAYWDSWMNLKVYSLTLVSSCLILTSSLSLASLNYIGKNGSSKASIKLFHSIEVASSPQIKSHCSYQVFDSLKVKTPMFRWYASPLVFSSPHQWCLDGLPQPLTWRIHVEKLTTESSKYQLNHANYHFWKTMS